MKRVLLVGPKININNKKSYGGGIGGYTRNMTVYLNYFKFVGIEIIPCFHTINGEINYSIFTKPIRLLFDSFTFFKITFKFNVDAVHILAQYRGAIFREFLIILFSKFLNLPVLYEIKAGSFISTYDNSGKVYKKAIDFIINNSTVILIEGKSYQSFLKEKFNKDSFYFPNVVPVDEIPESINEKFQDDFLKILFVGFAYEGKGIIELLDACLESALKGNKIALTIVGEIHPNVTSYINYINFKENFNLILKGKLSHDLVLKEFQLNDVYCYPSKHEGEGHNNTINEALMYEMVICSTMNGFLGSFLNEDNSYPIIDLSSKNLELRLQEIIRDKNKAKLKAGKGKRLILEHFNTDTAKKVLEKKYEELFMVKKI